MNPIRLIAYYVHTYILREEAKGNVRERCSARMQGASRQQYKDKWLMSRQSQYNKPYCYRYRQPIFFWKYYLELCYCLVSEHCTTLLSNNTPPQIQS
jgi:hypothetical protein